MRLARRSLREHEGQVRRGSFSAVHVQGNVAELRVRAAQIFDQTFAKELGRQLLGINDVHQPSGGEKSRPRSLFGAGAPPRHEQGLLSLSEDLGHGVVPCHADGQVSGGE